MTLTSPNAISSSPRRFHIAPPNNPNRIAIPIPIIKTTPWAANIDPPKNGVGSYSSPSERSGHIFSGPDASRTSADTSPIGGKRTRLNAPRVDCPSGEVTVTLTLLNPTCQRRQSTVEKPGTETSSPRGSVISHSTAISAITVPIDGSIATVHGEPTSSLLPDTLSVNTGGGSE